MDDMAYWGRFRRGAVGAEPINDVAQEVLAELAMPGSEAIRAADRAGIDSAWLAGTRVEVAEGEQGVEPILTTIVVSIAATAGSKVVESIWTDVLLPRIRRRLGADALGPRMPDPHPPDPHPSEKDS
jgi:hypothetical protein